MNERLQNHIIISITLILVALSFILGTWFIHYNQNELESAIRIKLDEKYTTLTSLIEITDRNGADDDISSIISDCSLRNEYEALLVKLSSLSKKELLTLQNLSDVCGVFYVQRKALMIAKVKGELQHYDDFITFLSTLTTHEIDSYKSEIFHEIVALEDIRSTLLFDQQKIQTEIITALINGDAVESAHVKKLVQDAQEIAQLLIVYDRQIDEKRKEING